MFHALLECSPEIQSMVAEMSDIIADPESSDDERGFAADAITEALAPALMADVVGKYSQFIKRSSDDESFERVQSARSNSPRTSQANGRERLESRNACRQDRH